MDRYLGMLGLCARAGRLITGEKACVQAIRGEGEGEAIVKVTYQCCNNNTCLVPETKEFKVKL